MRFLLVRMTKPFFEEKGKYSGISSRNFTAIKENISDVVENQLQHAQKLEASRQLASGVAHDFNNILTAIIGYGNILLAKLPAKSPLVTTTEQILAAAERGAGLSQKLQAFSREQISNPTPTDLNGVIERVEKLLYTLIGDNIKLVALLAKQPLIVMAANRQVEQVLITLVTNIRDAMPGGGTITLKSELVELDDVFCSTHGIDQKGRHALLAMFYTKLGMDDDTTHEILDPTSICKMTGKETDHGHSIIYGIIKKHNGQIICNSGPNGSKNVCIYFPIKEEAPETPLSPAAVILSGASTSYTILLVDGKNTSCSITRGLLEEFGYCVIEAADAETALEKYRAHPSVIHLVIIDGIIAGTSGIKIFQEIKSTIPVARIILCGAPEDSAIKQLRLHNSNLHFIAKPFFPKELLMNVREVIKDAI